MRPDREAGTRKARVAQALVMQGGLIVILLALAWFERNDRQSLLLYLSTLVIPVGWGYAFWSAHQWEESARREGRWTREADAAQRKKTFGLMGGLVVVWVALAMLVVWLV